MNYAQAEWITMRGASQRVRDMALALSEFLRLDKDEIEKIHIAAHLHDIRPGIP